MDSALPVIDPREAAEYGSFRVDLTRSKVLEYPAENPKDFLKEISSLRTPSAILLSPLLSTEYPRIQEAFPDAWILGLGLSEGPRTIAAVWDPVPACREAGIRGGAFLLSSGDRSPADFEVAIVSVQGEPADDPAAKAFQEGLYSKVPDPPLRFLSISTNASVEKIDDLSDELLGPGARVIFLNAGWYGLSIARTLDARLRERAKNTRKDTPLFVVLRLPNRSAPKDAPADIVISGDTGGLMKIFRSALKRKRETTIRVPETLAIGPKTSR